MADISQLEVNGTTYDICDATARDSLSQYVLKAGDTMSGTLVLQNSELDSDGTNPSSTQFGQKTLKFYDKDMDVIGYIQPMKNTDGANGLALVGAIKNDNTTYYNSLRAWVTPSGTAYYTVSSPAAFREALTSGTENNDAKFFRGDGQLTNVLVNTPFETLHTDYDLTLSNNNISTTKWPAAIRLLDKNSLPISYLGATVYSDGLVAASLYAYNYNTSGTNVGNNYINVFMRKDGTKSYGIADPAAFRSAIGASSGIWPISLGGTGASSAAKALSNLNIKSTSCTRKLGSGGNAYAFRIGNMLVVSGAYSGCTLSSTYDWADIAEFNMANLGITSTTSLGSYADASGGGPAYQGTSVNVGGRILSNKVQIQVSAVIDSKYVRFLAIGFCS